MAKAAEAFRTISEVAETLDVPKHVLRFWEMRFSHVRPMKRGGGRRYYRPTDIDLLQGIKQLLYFEGYTVKGVQKILRDQGVESVKRRGKGLTDTVAERLDASVAAPAPKRKASLTKSARPGPARAPEPRLAERRRLMLRLVDELEACRTRLGAAPRVPLAPAARRTGAA